MRLFKGKIELATHTRGWSQQLSPSRRTILGAFDVLADGVGRNTERSVSSKSTDTEDRKFFTDRFAIGHRRSERQSEQNMFAPENAIRKLRMWTSCAT